MKLIPIVVIFLFFKQLFANDFQDSTQGHKKITILIIGEQRCGSSSLANELLSGLHILEQSQSLDEDNFDAIRTLQDKKFKTCKVAAPSCTKKINHKTLLFKNVQYELVDHPGFSQMGMSNFDKEFVLAWQNTILKDGVDLVIFPIAGRRQFEGLSKVMEKINQGKKEKPLLLFVSTNGDTKDELFPLIKRDLKGIKIENNEEFAFKFLSTKLSFIYEKPSRNEEFQIEFANKVNALLELATSPVIIEHSELNDPSILSSLYHMGTHTLSYREYLDILFERINKIPESERNDFIKDFETLLSRYIN